MKKAEKAVQTARDTTIAVKKTAKAVTHAIKALIEATKASLSALTAGGWIAVMILIIVILFGGFLCMTGGDNSSTVSSVSAEVEAYEPLIRQYANQYGIGEYVELIKAIMMQESGGRGLDPMQCSEGSFNTKYPRQPNGITDPEYSISCGVQEIIWKNSDRHRQSGNRSGGSIAGRKRRNDLLELVWIWRQGRVVFRHIKRQEKKCDSLMVNLEYIQFLKIDLTFKYYKRKI